MMTVHIPARSGRGRPWSSRSLRFIAGTLTLALSVTLVDGASPADAAASKAPAAPKKSAATQAADIPSARVAARLSGKRVEALSERTETSTTWANKDGSLTTELTAGPVRFEDETTGGWRDVDLELVQGSDGSVEPTAHPRGLKLAGKTGTPAKSLKAAQASTATDLVTLGEGEQQIALQWKGGLPAPKLEGTRAEYVNALPGADVVVEATRTGFEQFVEIKQKPATDGYTYTLPLKAKGLKATQQVDGSVLFTDKKNKKQALMPAPVMWDSTVDERSGERTRRVPVAMKVVTKGSSVDLVITPDAEFLADPATKYPVTVDPSTSVFQRLRHLRPAGRDPRLVHRHRARPGQPRHQERRRHPAYRPVIHHVEHRADLRRPGDQREAEPVELPLRQGRLRRPAMGGVVGRQGDHRIPVDRAARLDADEGDLGGDQGRPRVPVPPGQLDQRRRHHLGPGMGLGEERHLRYGPARGRRECRCAVEADELSQRRHQPPKLVVTYNYRPRTGTKQEAGPPYFSYGGAYVVNTMRPTLRDTFVDPNGDKIQGAYQIFDSATNTQVGDVLRSAFVPSGQPAPVVVPAGVLTGGKTYKFRSSPYDGTHYNLGWSEWKTFTVDTTPPSAPTGISSTDYPPAAWVKGAGQAGTFTVTPPTADHNWFEWSLDGVTWTKFATGGTSGAKAISITPPKDGTHTLQVRTVDKADNKSEPIEYTFHAGPGGFIQPGEGERTARRLPLVAEAEAAKYDKVSFSWRRSEADPWVKIPAGDVTSSGTALSAWPVPMTGGKNAPLVWNATSTVDPDGSVQIKADFTGPSSASGSTEPLTVIVDRNADGAAGSEAGPGSVNLLTGDYTLSASDASAFGLSVSRTATSRTPDKAIKQEGQAPIFGKEWVAGTGGELTDSDYSHIRRTSDTAVAVVDSEGEETHFTANAGKTGWISEPGSEDLTLKGSVSGSFTLTDTEGTVTQFAKADAAATTWQVSSTLLDGLANSTTTVISETVTVDGKKLARPKRVIAPTSAATAAACTTDSATKGCRVMEYVYATSTTATDAAFGDVSGQVKEVRLWSTAPGAAAATSKSVQMYLYDGTGRLRQTWDPQITPSLKTEYAYDTAGRVIQQTTPGELPWTFTYGKAGNAATAGEGMLLKATRPGLQQGTTSTEAGTAATSVVYDVPLTGSAAPTRWAPRM